MINQTWWSFFISLLRKFIIMIKLFRKGIITFTFIYGGLLFSQTHVLEGRVLDEKDNSPLQGVVVKVNDKETKTDVSGYYVISLDTGKNYTVKFFYKGYKEKDIDEVEIKESENTNLDILLSKNNQKDKEEKEIEGIVLKSSAKKETVASTIGLQKNMGVVSQVVGIEAIKKSPDKNTGEVLKEFLG